LDLGLGIRVRVGVRVGLGIVLGLGLELGVGLGLELGLVLGLGLEAIHPRLLRVYRSHALRLCDRLLECAQQRGRGLALR